MVVENSTVSERIKMLTEHFFEGNKSAFAKAIGISNQSLGEIIGGRQSAPSFKALQKLFASFPKVRMEWVMFGTGPMFRGEDRNEILKANQLGKTLSDKLLEEIEASEEMQGKLTRALDIARAEAWANQEKLTQMYAVADVYFNNLQRLSVRLGISEGEARQIVASHRIRCVNFGSEGYRISELAVREFLGDTTIIS